MDNLSKQLAEDFFLREPADPRIKQSKQNVDETKTTLRVEMQTLRLNSDSQKMVLDTLRFLHGQDFKLESANAYKDKGSSLSKRYWMERGNLVVQGGCDYSLKAKPDILSSENKFRQFALRKLESYGFHKPHCAEALDYTAENVEKALQVLFSKYFDVDLDHKPTNTPTNQELIEMRNDEIAVLKSIYDTSFNVKEINIWNVRIEVDYIAKLYAKIDTKKLKTKENINYNNKNNNFKTKNSKDIPCRNFKIGKCVFGERCRFSHKQPDKEIETVIDIEKITYELEIRFPDQSAYPYEVPIIFFRPQSATEKLPELLCLRITARLVDEAKTLALDGIPSIYSLTELVKNEEDIVNFLEFDTRKFPEMSDMLFPQLVEAPVIQKRALASHYEKAQSKDRNNINMDEVLKEDCLLAKRFLERASNERYRKMLDGRRKLPAWAMRGEILSTISNSQVTVISGETGCGKSTQVPQYLLDDWLEKLNANIVSCHSDIICTQPRRISAIGVAERVADERIEKIGHSVGYQIRLESKISSKTRLTFCTTGILLRRLEYDPQLKSVTHVIVDEVHERSEESDFLLLILRDLIKVRRDLKIILMSATLNADLFSNYFGNVPVLEIPGRTFAVEQIFLEDIMEITQYVMEENGPYSKKIKRGDKRQDLETELDTCDLKAESNIAPKLSVRDENLTISQIVARYPNSSKLTCKNLFMMDTEKIDFELIENVLTYIVTGDHDWPREGAILIFLPGIGEITSLHDQLSDSPLFGKKSSKFVLVPLHSSLTSEEQSRVFDRPKNGARKIVLSTNIAETSVTIDDCVFVVDSGKMKEKRFDSNRNMESLDMVWVSRANAKQRKGRAGRVMPGVCIHLYTSHRYTHHLLEQPVPEIQRVPLEQLVLKIKILPLFEMMNIHEVLAKTLEPPSVNSIEGAMCRLQDVGALDKNFALTPLGRHLAALPVDVRVGKLMLLGAIFCCVDSALTIAACLSHRNPFVAPFGKKDEANVKRREFATHNSDQLTILRAYKKWRSIYERNRHAAMEFTNENYLSHKSLQMICDIKQQFLTLLSSIGFVPAIPDYRKRIGEDRVCLLTGPELNVNGDNERLLAALLCGALYPNVVKVLTPEKSFQVSAGGAVPRQPLPEELKFKTKTDGYVSIHPSSVNYTVGHFPSPYLVYQEKVKTSRVFLRDCSMVLQIPLMLFAGCELGVELHDGTFVVSLEDGWIMFQVENHEVAEMLKAIRHELVQLLEEKINDPCLNLLHHEKGEKIINTIVQLVTAN